MHTYVRITNILYVIDVTYIVRIKFTGVVQFFDWCCADGESLRLWRAEELLSLHPGEQPLSPLGSTSQNVEFSSPFLRSGGLLAQRTSHNEGGSASPSLPPPSSSDHTHAPLWAAMSVCVFLFLLSAVTEPVFGQDPSLLHISDKVEILSQFRFSI